MSRPQRRQDGATIRQLRQQQGTKSSQFAEQVGIAQSTLIGVENGNFQASPELVARIADELGVAYVDILSEHGKQELAS